MANIHIKVDDKLKRKAQKKAFMQWKTLTEIIKELLEKWLKEG